jgi:hypothetical protein
MESKNCRKRRDTERDNRPAVELLKLADTIVCVTIRVLLAPPPIAQWEFEMDCN